MNDLKFQWNLFIGTGLKVKVQLKPRHNLSLESKAIVDEFNEANLNTILNPYKGDIYYYTPLVKSPKSLTDEEYLELFYDSCYITENIEVYNGRDSKDCFIMRHDQNKSINFCIRKGSKVHILAQFCYGNGSLYSNTAHINAFRFINGLHGLKTIYNYEALLKAGVILDAGEIYEK